MPFMVGVPAPNAGDIKVLHQATGTLNAGSGSTSVSSFVRPILGAGEQLVSVVCFDRNGSQTTNFSVNNTLDTVTTTAPQYTAGIANAISICNAWARLQDLTLLETIEITDNALSVKHNNTTWGNISATGTLYLNISRQNATNYLWTWTVYIIKRNVK